MIRERKHKKLSLYRPLITIKSYQDELPINYLMRLADINGYNFAGWLINVNEAKDYIGGLPSYFKAYQLLAEYLWTGFQQQDKTFELCSLPINYLVNKVLRYCPLCLKEKRYYRLTWQLKISFACLKHKIWLMDICPICGELAQNNIRLNCICKNGHNVSSNQEVIIKIPSQLYFLQCYLLNGHLKQTHKALVQSLDLDLKERIKLFLFLLRWLPSVIKSRKKLYRGYHKLDKLKSLLMELSYILLSGVLGFWRLIYKLDKFDKENRQRKKHKAVFVRFYRSFYNQFSESKYRIFREIIEKFITRNWQKQITKRNVFYNPSIVDSYDWIPIKQAVEEYCIAPVLLKRAIKEKLIISLISKKENRTFVLLYAPSIRPQLHRLRNIIDFKEAQKRLGITKAQLNQLIEANHFPDAVPPKRGDNQKWQFSTEVIQYYLQSFFNFKSHIEGNTVSIADAMRVIGSRIKKPLPKLLNQIRESLIAVTVLDNHHKNIKSLAISSEQLNQWITESIATNDYLTVPKVAKRLKINQEFAYQLINANIIKYLTYDDNKTKMVSELNLEIFTDKCIFLAQISRATNIGSRTLMAYFADKEIYPIDHLWIKKLRLKVFYREQLKKLTILKDIV